MEHLVEVSPEPGSAGPVRADDLRDAAGQIADLLAATALRVGDRATWARWRAGADGRRTARPGDPSVYDGDAGIGWACAHLARALGRDDLADLARAATAQVLDVVQGQGATRTLSAQPTPSLGRGLLTGAGGVLVAAEQVGRALDDRVLLSRVDETVRAVHHSRLDADGATRRRVAPSAPTQGGTGSPDLMSGSAGALLAGILLASPVPGRDAPGRRQPLADLVAGARWHAGTATWCDTTPPSTRAGGASCGIAHGASGIALALGEAAAASIGTSVATRAATDLLDGALAWESAWFDPRTGGWPDLRVGGEKGGGSSSWCLGGAGIGAVRLRLLAHVRSGRLELRTPAESLRADVDAALRLAVRDLDVGCRTGWNRQGPDGVSISVCHGVSGALDLLALAADELDVPEHRETARWYAEDLLEAAGDPRGWPSGVAGMPADAGLYTGLAGVALTLLRVSGERSVPSPLLPLLPLRSSGSENRCGSPSSGADRSF